MIDIAISRKAFPVNGQTSAKPVIGQFHLKLQANEFVCLFGPSGCGKTTLFNLISGLDSDFDGDIRFHDSRGRPMIGYVFQNPRLLPWRTVRQNIELAINGDVNAAAVDELLEAMQLTSFQNEYPERLSLGMSRRVAIIRAFIINPDLLLMDEPFVSLDAATAKQARELLLQLWQQRPHTVLFVTHDLREAIMLADRIVFLSASPMRVFKEITVPIARNERDNESLTEAFRNQILLENQIL